MDTTADGLPRMGLDLVKELIEAGGSPRGIGKTMRFRGKSVERGIAIFGGLSR